MLSFTQILLIALLCCLFQMKGPDTVSMLDVTDLDAGNVLLHVSIYLFYLYMY